MSGTLKIIREWERRLDTLNKNIYIHREAIDNKVFTSDMRTLARENLKKALEYKELLEETIRRLKDHGEDKYR